MNINLVCKQICSQAGILVLVKVTTYASLYLVGQGVCSYLGHFQWQ